MTMTVEEAHAYVVENELDAVICGHGEVTRVNAELLSAFVD